MDGEILSRAQLLIFIYGITLIISPTSGRNKTASANANRFHAVLSFLSE